MIHRLAIDQVSVFFKLSFRGSLCFCSIQLEVSVRRAATVSELRLDAAVFADSLTRVLECGAAAVERARKLLVGATAPPTVQTHSLLPRAIAIIQPAVRSLDYYYSL